MLQIISQIISSKATWVNGKKLTGTNKGYEQGYADGIVNSEVAIQSTDISSRPAANSNSITWNLSSIPNYQNLELYKNLFPYMVSALDMANWNTSMQRTCVGYTWGYTPATGILSLSIMDRGCTLVNYGTEITPRVVKVYYYF